MMKIFLRARSLCYCISYSFFFLTARYSWASPEDYHPCFSLIKIIFKGEFTQENFAIIPLAHGAKSIFAELEEDIATTEELKALSQSTAFWNGTTKAPSLAYDRTRAAQLAEIQKLIQAKNFNLVSNKLDALFLETETTYLYLKREADLLFFVNDALAKLPSPVDTQQSWNELAELMFKGRALTPQIAALISEKNDRVLYEIFTHEISILETRIAMHSAQYGRLFPLYEMLRQELEGSASRAGSWPAHEMGFNSKVQVAYDSISEYGRPSLEEMARGDRTLTSTVIVEGHNMRLSAIASFHGNRMALRSAAEDVNDEEFREAMSVAIRRFVAQPRIQRMIAKLPFIRNTSFAKTIRQQIAFNEFDTYVPFLKTIVDGPQMDISFVTLKDATLASITRNGVEKVAWDKESEGFRILMAFASDAESSFTKKWEELLEYARLNDTFFHDLMKEATIDAALIGRRSHLQSPSALSNFTTSAVAVGLAGWGVYTGYQHSKTYIDYLKELILDKDEEKTHTTTE